ncbi:MAG: GAF domain-containing sensor histidine kinase [Chloroflexota bacterium]|jgi:signal transduction histidine kinase
MLKNPSSSIEHRIAADATTTGQLSGAWLTVARAAWIVLALAAAGILATSLPAYRQTLAGDLAHISAEGQSNWTAILAALSGVASLAAALLSLGLALLFFRRRFREPMVATLSFYLVLYAIVMAGPLERWAAYWLEDDTVALRLQGLLIAMPSIALFAVFPNGRFVPRWSRWLVVLTLPLSVALFLLPSYNPADLGGFGRTSLIILALGLIGLFAAGLYAQFIRYRRESTPVERQQAKWVMYGFALWLVYILLSSIPYYYLESLPAGSPVPAWASLSVLGWFLALNIIPVSLAVAVTRYRLWNIDVIINRSLVYGTLTACVILLYVLTVGAMGALFQAQGNWLVALIATGLVAVLFQPLRERLQRWVNRLLYGRRDEPFEVLASLGQRLEDSMSPEKVYPTIVETVAQTLRLPYAAIAIDHGGQFETAVSYGKPSPRLISYPLVYQGQEVGQLKVAPRPPEEAFNEADDRLLRNIARQAGTAVHAVQLADDLQQSRQEIITSREEERRRLRRDLHDGLGPSLAAHMLKIGSARALLAERPEMTDKLLAEMEVDVENTLADLRRIVYDLRPPALDQWGLTGALRAYAETCQQNDANSILSIRVNAPEILPPLPAAVEVAAYHIGREGLNNVVRHAGAGRCELKLFVDGDKKKRLHLSIRDDGRGIGDDARAGIGLAAMRERAAELGGSCLISSPAGEGTLVTTILPFQATEGS